MFFNTQETFSNYRRKKAWILALTRYFFSTYRSIYHGQPDFASSSLPSFSFFCVFSLIFFCVCVCVLLSSNVRRRGFCYSSVLFLFFIIFSLLSSFRFICPVLSVATLGLHITAHYKICSVNQHHFSARPPDMTIECFTSTIFLGKVCHKNVRASFGIWIKYHAVLLRSL